MMQIQRYMLPQNGFTANLIRFVPHFKELRVSWTACDIMSEGMEKFVEEYLPIIRSNNPQVTYRYHRTQIRCDPFLVGIYEWERKRKMRCSFKHENQILAMVEQMAVGGDFRPGRKRGVNTRLPRGQELWDTETRGHDIFKVHSKWKADEPDPEELTSMTHPHLTYRKMLRKRSQM